MDSISLFQNRCFEVDAIESARRRELESTPSTNMRYSTTLYHVEGLKQDVHELVSIPRMADM